jgi:hypothetical protein
MMIIITPQRDLLSLLRFITSNGAIAAKTGAVTARMDSRKVESGVAQYEIISYFCALNTENQYGNGQSLSNYRKAHADG